MSVNKNACEVTFYFFYKVYPECKLFSIGKHLPIHIVIITQTLIFSSVEKYDNYETIILKELQKSIERHQIVSKYKAILRKMVKQLQRK